MDWRFHLLFVLWMIIVPFSYCSSAASGSQNGISPYFDLVLCPMRPEPWTCAKSQSARILDVWDVELQKQWEKLKADADQQLKLTMEKRGYSATDVVIREKPSTILKKIEIGTNYMKEYLAETLNGFLGREYEKMQSNEVERYRATQATGKNVQENEEEEDDGDDDDDGTDDDGGGGGYYDAENESYDNENDYDEKDEKYDYSDKNKKPETADGNDENAEDVADVSTVEEFIEIDGAGQNGQLKRPGLSMGGKKQKKKMKKKGQNNAQPATLVVVQPIEHESNIHPITDTHPNEPVTFEGNSGHRKPLKQKRKKRKKKHQHGGSGSTVVVEQGNDDHFGLGLLESLIDSDDILTSSGGHRKKKGNPTKYGRSNGVTRGKKKKKKKALMKLVLLGTFLKAKIELLLKLLGAHLQIKFFAIALIGLLINIARFWIDVKRGGAPQKVIYVEHAHHQHHYEDHGDDWNEQGGYWKRSLQTASSLDEPNSTDSYQLRPHDDPQYMAYRNH